ncbi:hypothetical protein [Phocaeicola oris]|uniref:hypothetical protein n=1 Tax=Phocaeicola oris TaxID=2896850 RepID=UPI00234EDF0E|nr:hypothetical protein [Phocaeicola oris]MCE2616770.1 hypothetical protein [Phocaeicola oris]
MRIMIIVLFGQMERPKDGLVDSKDKQRVFRYQTDITVCEIQQIIYQANEANAHKGGT